jgi:arylsulfatase A-like enzyme
MLSVEDILRNVMYTLNLTGRLNNTYVIFTSDNGFHLGQHRLPMGKQTPFEEDIHVPLVIYGPNVPTSRKVDNFVSNIDLSPTIASLAGVATPTFVDGTSFKEILLGQAPPQNARTDTIIEHRGSANVTATNSISLSEVDDDAFPPGALNTKVTPLAVSSNWRAIRVPFYRALRNSQYLYVEYDDSNQVRQLYDIRKDPFELHNIASTASPLVLGLLSARLAYLANCHGAQCRAH